MRKLKYGFDVIVTLINTIVAFFLVVIFAIYIVYWRHEGDDDIKVICRLGKGILLIIKYIYGITCHVEGLEHIRPGDILICKHQSLFETIAMLFYVPNLRSVAKHTIAYLPIVQYYIKIICIFIDRKNKTGVRSLIKDIQQSLDRGHYVMVYPEGTRVPILSNVSDYPYRWSISLLYKRGYRFVPVALNTGVFLPPGIFSIARPGHATIRILPPIQSGMKLADFQQFAENVIQSNANELSIQALKQIS